MTVLLMAAPYIYRRALVWDKTSGYLRAWLGILKLNRAQAQIMYVPVLNSGMNSAKKGVILGKIAIFRSRAAIARDNSSSDAQRAWHESERVGSLRAPLSHHPWLCHTGRRPKNDIQYIFAGVA